MNTYSLNTINYQFQHKKKHMQQINLIKTLLHPGIKNIGMFLSFMISSVHNQTAMYLKKTPSWVREA